jgi:transcriptional regulator with XRE-family HTH domain
MTGAELRAMREARGWSQGDVGALLGTSAMTVCRWERVQARPSRYQVRLLLGLAGCAPDRGPAVAAAVRAGDVPRALGLAFASRAAA